MSSDDFQNIGNEVERVSPVDIKQDAKPTGVTLARLGQNRRGKTGRLPNHL